MKGMFPQYEEHAQQDFDRAWKYGVFVFDTNVLLNLYRYHTKTRDELIKVIGQLSERIWIPYHVALEFQRNRLKVIAEQNRRFSEVKRTVEKSRSSLFGELDSLQLHKRHALINPEPLMTGFSKLVETFLSELENLRKNQQSLTDPDPLKEKIEALFDGRVGSPPESQSVVDEIYKEGEKRFKLRIPPGYQDADKDKDQTDGHLHHGIIYKRKFGDYMVWRQMIDHAKNSQVKHLIFVTDDNKEDWWRKIESDGPKVIGPRPELVEEAQLLGEVDTFLMYNPEGFLKYAKEFLKAQVSEETLQEVRDVSQIGIENYIETHELNDVVTRAERSVMNWLITKFVIVEKNQYGFPDFIIDQGGRRFGFDVKVISNPQVLFHRLKETLFRAYQEIEEGRFSEIAIVVIVSNVEFVISNIEYIEKAKRNCMKTFHEWVPPGNIGLRIKLIIGVINEDPSSGEGEFIPYDDLS